MMITIIAMTMSFVRVRANFRNIKYLVTTRVVGKQGFNSVESI